MAQSSKILRCAIYTRKSTEHGLEQEFNSLAAQREACEAYIKSQASQGWRTLPKHYDDAAYSGGNLERPALKALLKDIDGGKIDVVVVYKIDRLTRSLADFAKLVEVFDGKSVSFVAITQQFNTTTSMGRLTLNVLLSFAQFERELASERVRDKIAASRAKGKWTGGSVPLGYDVKDKKLIPNRAEQRTVRYIYNRYLELKSFGKLVLDLDAKGIVTKKRSSKAYQGGIPFTYGPLAYLLKNRLYIGEMGHRGKWHRGEHPALLDKTLFDRVQLQLAENSNERPKRNSQSGALLTGKLHDDRGNLMSPSFSSKNGVRYRFYVSSALLRGRKTEVGSIGRVSAIEIEEAVQTWANGRKRSPDKTKNMIDQIQRVTVTETTLKIVLNSDRRTFKCNWRPKRHRSVRPDNLLNVHTNDNRLLQMVVRARAWHESLIEGKFESAESLARSIGLHPKILRQQLRCAHLNPHLMQRALANEAIALPRNFQTSLSMRWNAQPH